MFLEPAQARHDVALPPHEQILVLRLERGEPLVGAHLGRALGSRLRKARVVPQDRFLELDQPAAGVEAEVLTQGLLGT